MLFGFSAWGEYVVVVPDLSFQTEILFSLNGSNSSSLNCPRPLFLRSWDGEIVSWH